ncbi:MAG: class I SAM-dependent methyltransferase [bacterium]|nr:class I SAM-dependent methyltransferase [bacterium]
MYLTEVYKNNADEEFDWETFFSAEHDNGEVVRRMDPDRLIQRLREHLKEDYFKLSFVTSRMMRSLLKGMDIKEPRVLELGAATGFLTRWLLSQYGGSGVLVDRSPASFRAYSDMKDNLKRLITYERQDIYQLELEGTFDLVCSFGLIEHFTDKNDVMAAHGKYLADDGHMIILVPQDTPLTRAFTEIHPELNLGYRELLTEKELKNIIKNNGLEVLAMEVSNGYSYDFVGALCRK